MSGVAWTLAVAQMDCATGDTERNLATIARFAREAASRQADLVVFPECATTGYFLGSRLADLAEPADGPTAARIAAIARENALTLAVGAYTKRDGGIYDSQLLFGPDGRPRGLRQGPSLRRRARELPRRRRGVRGGDGARQGGHDGLLRLHLRRLRAPPRRPRRRSHRQQHQLDRRRLPAGDLGLERAGDAGPRRHPRAGERHVRRHGQPRRRGGAGARPLLHQPRPFVHRRPLGQDPGIARGRRGARRGADRHRAGGPRPLARHRHLSRRPPPRVDG